MSDDNQVTGIERPHGNDVLSGRGNFVNAHPGNKRFRQYVTTQRENYVATPKSEKPLFAKMIVNTIRNLNPPGRFLKQDQKSELWFEIGDKAAWNKTRQALREGAPIIKEQLESAGQNSVDSTGVLNGMPSSEMAAVSSEHLQLIFHQMQVAALNPKAPMAMNPSFPLSFQTSGNTQQLPIPNQCASDSQPPLDHPNLLSGVGNPRSDSVGPKLPGNESNQYPQDPAYNNFQSNDGATPSQQTAGEDEALPSVNVATGNEPNPSFLYSDESDSNLVRRQSALWRMHYPVSFNEDEELNENNEVEVETEPETDMAYDPHITDDMGRRVPLRKSFTKKDSDVTPKNQDSGRSSKMVEFFTDPNDKQDNFHSRSNSDRRSSLKRHPKYSDSDISNTTYSFASTLNPSGVLNREKLNETRRSSRSSMLRSSIISMGDLSMTIDENEPKSTSSEYRQERQKRNSLSLEDVVIYNRNGSSFSTLEDFMMPGMRLSISENMSLVDSEIFSIDQGELDKWEKEADDGKEESIEEDTEYQRRDSNLSDVMSMMSGVSF